MTTNTLNDRDLIDAVRRRLMKCGYPEDQHLAQMLGVTKGGLSLMQKRLDEDGTPLSKQARYGLENLLDLPENKLHLYAHRRITSY